jgi:hypothetical protein
MRFVCLVVTLTVFSGCDRTSAQTASTAGPIAAGWTPPQGVAASGDCWTRVEELDARAKSQVVDEFRRRNGAEWSEVEVGSFSGQVERARRAYSAERSGGAPEENARRFVRRNADIFGLRASDFSGLKWVVEEASGGRELVAVRAVGGARETEDDRLSGGKARNRKVVSFELASDGEVVAVAIEQGDDWTLALPQCDPVRVTAQVAEDTLRSFCSELATRVAQDPRLAMFTEGSQCPTGADDIAQKLALGVYDIEHFADRIEARERRRAYRFRTYRGDYFVDATTGELSVVERR